MSAGEGEDLVGLERFFLVNDGVLYFGFHELEDWRMEVGD
jgi:hypothetical protein